MYTAPTAIRGLMRHGDEWPNKYDLSSLRLLGSVGEPINPEAWMWYYTVDRRRALPHHGHVVADGDGCHLITPNPVDAPQTGLGDPALPRHRSRRRRQERQAAPEGKGGYLVIRQPWPAMMRTIFQDPDRYETYWNTIPGVYFAGTPRTNDEDGYFWIQGRVDDVITKAGHRLGSMEIESALVEHDAVVEAAVIGKPHPVTGESIKAFIILAKGVQGSDELMTSSSNSSAKRSAPSPSPTRSSSSQPAQDPQRQDHAPPPQSAGAGDADGRHLDARGLALGDALLER